MYTNSLDVHCESRQTRFIYRLFGQGHNFSAMTIDKLTN